MTPERAIQVERVDEAFRLIAEGKSLTVALAHVGVPVSSFFEIIHDNPSLSEKYARAQHSRADLHADEILDIADNEAIDPHRARNMIEARKWHTSKMKPNKFGDRIDVNVTERLDLRGAIALAEERLRPLRDLSNVEDAELIETKQITTVSTTDYKSVDAPESGDAGEKSSEDIPDRKLD